MKKLLTLLMALVMVFALAAPAMAWVGWDAPEAADPEDEALLDDFELSGVRLEYFASSSATFSWNREYYAEYSPDNKGVVEGTHIRGFFSLTLPALSDVPAAVKGQLGYMAVNITAGNMQISTVEVYKSVAGGTRTKVNDYTVNDTKLKYSMSADSFNSTKQVCYEFMVIGYAKSAKDVTLTAKMSIGQSAFSSGVYTFTTAKGVKYEVTHTGNYFYVKNISTGANATAGIVRFTVDKDSKVTDIAVSIGSGTVAGRALTPITKYQYDAYDADNKAMKDDNTEIIQDWEETIVRKHYNLFNNDGIAVDTWIKNHTAAEVEDAYNSIALGLGYKQMTYRDTLNRDGTVKTYGDYQNETMLVYLYKQGYTDVIFFTDIVTYKDIDEIITSSKGDIVHEVTLTSTKYAIDEGEDTIQSVADYYYATKNADTAKTTFTQIGTSQSLGYMSRKEVYEAYQAVKENPEDTTSLEYQYNKVVEADWANDPDDQWAGKVNYYQLPDGDVATSVIGPGHAKHASYLKIFEQVLSVLGFEWDGTTKYMYEDKFVELFGANVSISNTLTWKAYTADLIVPDGTEPPQTGDSASIVGFVMIALAVLAAGAVVIKKVRA